MKIVTHTGVLVALALSLSLPARAGTTDVAYLTAKLNAAATDVTSFVMKLQYVGTTGISGTVTFVRPLRMKSVTSIGSMTVETYVVDGSVYIHSPVGWQKMTVGSAKSAAAAMNLAAGLTPPQVKILPDRQDGGRTVGVMQINAKIPAAAGSSLPPNALADIVCTYDKTSYRMNSCANTFITMTYEKYNDPSNVVDLPPAAKNAVPLVVTTPAGSAPAPADSSSPATGSTENSPAPDVPMPAPTP